MYYYISGELVLYEENFAVIDAGGVGYKLNITGTTLGKLAAHADKKHTTLYTYLAVREDAMELYGFYTNEELTAFKLLLSVSGVGAKSALSILSLLSPERFALAVSTGDTKSISKASGIGAKTAARIVLELKDKISKQLSSDGETAAEENFPDTPGNMEEAQNALLVLGYSRQEAHAALKNLSPSLPLEDMIREALKKLMKN